MYLTFEIGMPHDKVEEARRALAGVGVRFDPRNQIMAANAAFRSDSTLTGDDLPRLVEQVNSYIREARVEPPVDTDHESWDLPRIQEFLEFAIQDFHWEDGRIEYAWWDASPQDWREQVVEARKLVFPQGHPDSRQWEPA